MLYQRIYILVLLLVTFGQCIKQEAKLSTYNALPNYLADGSVSTADPWANVDPAGQAPTTGQVRHYEFSVSRDYMQPDGYNKSGLLINGQFPGPLIQANWGDMISVTIVNNIVDDTEEGVTFHWHGITQSHTPYYDGVPGTSQCPIPPGKNFTYTFQADAYGTSWYHSHYSAQFIDGLHGPLVIYGPTQPEISYDQDLGPLLLSDYLHDTYFQILEESFQIPPAIPTFASNLMNGKGILNCSYSTTTPCDPYANLQRLYIQPGKTYRLRLINSGAAMSQRFSIDNHEMTIVANDFVPVVPYKTKLVTLGNGQRTDIVFTAKGNMSDVVYMRSDMDVACLPAPVIYPQGLTALIFGNTDPGQLTPDMSITSQNDTTCMNDPLSQTVPYYSKTPPTPGTSQTIEVTIGTNATGHMLFYVDNSSLTIDYNDPVLMLTEVGNISYPDAPRWNVYDFGANSSVQMIIKNTIPQQHPMHLHGHTFWVLAEGNGTWDGTTTNPTNPQRRDTHIVGPGSVESPSYVVLQWMQDNPGIWPLHCHTIVHIAIGLGILVMEQPSLVQNMTFPPSLAQTCTDWAYFSSTTVVDQIDAGL